MLTIVSALPWETARFRSRLHAPRRTALGDGAFALSGSRGPVQVRVLVTGPGGERAERAAAALTAPEPATRSVLSVGVAGGLDPALTPGALILATRVQHRRERGGGRGPALDVDWGFRSWLAAALRRRGLDPYDGELLSHDTPLGSAAAKRRAAMESRALAVQMEDDIWALRAQEQGLPFASLRALLDPAGANLPPPVLGWDPAGPSTGALARAVARRPHLIPALVRLARQRRAAVRALDRALEAVIAAHTTPADRARTAAAGRRT